MSMGISKFGKQKQMKEMRTLNNLLEKFKNPTNADYATIAIAYPLIVVGSLLYVRPLHLILTTANTRPRG